MNNMKPIETGTNLGTVYVNCDHVTHITAQEDEEFSKVWLASGESFHVEGTPAEVKNKLAA